MPTKTITLLSVLAAFCLQVAPLHATTLNADERPNIIVILCDDLGYGDLECYGHPHIKTPHLNRLAAEGVRFTRCYSAAPVCSSSRVGLLTGRSPNRAGVYDWIPAANGPTPNAREQVHMQADEITTPQVLNDAGYATCLAGKWHCNSRFNHADQPQPGDFGFDHWLATQNNAAPSHENPVNFVRNGEPVGRIEGYSCQIAVDEVVGWISKIDRDKPFFVFLPFHEPHEPVASPKELVDHYRPVAENEDQAQYFANVANVDAAVGKLLKNLGEMSLRENTLIIFTSDNGPETLNRYPNAARSYGRTGPLRGMKLHTYDGGFRVAGIANWPAKIPGGEVSAQVVSSLDFLPTFAKLAGARMPEADSLDGVDLTPMLSDAEIVRDKPLVWAYYNAINDHRVAMCDGKYKVLASINDAKLPKLTNITKKLSQQLLDARLTDVQVFDITTDDGELNDLAVNDSELAAAMLKKLNAAYMELLNDSHFWEEVKK